MTRKWEIVVREKKEMGKCEKCGCHDGGPMSYMGSPVNLCDSCGREWNYSRVGEDDDIKYEVIRCMISRYMAGSDDPCGESALEKAIRDRSIIVKEGVLSLRKWLSNNKEMKQPVSKG